MPSDAMTLDAEQGKMHSIKNFLRLWLPTIIYAILILWISSLERPFEVEFEVKNIDKIIHFFEYLIFGLLIIRAVRGSDSGVSGNAAILITFLIGSFYGFADELHQSVVPGRFAAVSDFIFDSLGTLAGAIIFLKVESRK